MKQNKKAGRKPRKVQASPHAAQIQVGQVFEVTCLEGNVAECSCGEQVSLKRGAPNGAGGLISVRVTEVRGNEITVEPLPECRLLALLRWGNKIHRSVTFPSALFDAVHGLDLMDGEEPEVMLMDELIGTVAKAAEVLECSPGESLRIEILWEGAVIWRGALKVPAEDKQEEAVESWARLQARSMLAVARAKLAT